MSLVITAWNQSVGIAVCDGLSRGYVDGQMVTIAEDYYKLARLPNGEILGFAGRVRDGYPLTNRLSAVIENHLLPHVTLAASEMGFSELCDFIRKVLELYAVRWPDSLLFVSLLGEDKGIVRCRAWDSNGNETSEPDGDRPHTTWRILTTSELSEPADNAVRSALRAIGGLCDPRKAGEVLQNVIRSLAASTDAINGNTRVEYFKPKPPFAALTADMIKTGTLDASAVDIKNINASNISTGTLSASKVLFPDGSALTTASRVSTAKASIIPAGVSVPGNNTLTALSGLSWTITAASGADVFNVSGFLRASGSMAGEMISEIYIYVDSNHTTNYGDGAVCAVIPGSTVSAYAASGSFFAVITGLTAGNHTVQIYATASVAGGNSVAFTGFGFCQRVF